MTTTYAEHPFAQYIRILGKGKQGSRPLTQTEAYQAMQMIMADEVEPVQVGAFMMLMRVKEETHEELANFVLAVRDSIKIPSEFPQVDLDWSSYAGKRRHLPWFLLSTLLLAKNGVSVFMHGASGHTEGRLYTDEVLPVLGIKLATSFAEVAEQITHTNFAYMSLEHLCPKLHEIIELRPLMGLRSPVHTLARMINPFKAPYMMQGIFHPSYRPVHQEAALLLNQPHLAVLKGEGGEIECNPDLECLVQSVDNGKLSDETWPPLFKQRHIKDEEMNPQRLAEVWQGKTEDEFGEGSVIATTAVTLKTLGKVASIDEAHQVARQMWENRTKH
jgi:anthranilate phosphoribosyltransferase